MKRWLPMLGLVLVLAHRGRMRTRSPAGCPPDCAREDPQRVYLPDADMSDVSLFHADLTGARLDGADLSGAAVTRRGLAQPASLSGALLPDGSLHP
jgi:hypothetical protein